MKEWAEEIGLLNMIDAIKLRIDVDHRFCFILGAGASVSSGIPSGAEMATQWLDDIKKLKPKETERWIIDENIDEKDIGRYYSKLYEMRFDNPSEGYIWLQNAMKGAVPGLGYYHLAKILTTDKTPMNHVITTNFDRLIEDAIFMYTDKKPIMVTHEYLAHYLDNQRYEGPIIAKIHRDLMLHPKSAEGEINQLAESWEQALMKTLNVCTPIVIGYNGNDGSLMKLLEKFVAENGMKKTIYWCYRKNDLPKNERIIELLNKCSGFLVPILNFDAVMYMLGIKFGHTFSEELLEKQLQMRISDYCEKHRKTKENIENGLDNLQYRSLTDDEKAVKREVSNVYKNEIRELTEKTKRTSKIARLYYHRGRRHLWLNEFNKALKDFSKAIKRESNNAEYYYLRGSTCGWLNKVKKALKDHKKAIKIADGGEEFDRDVATYYNYRGVNYYRLRKYKKAVADHEKAIKLDPKNARYRAWLSYPLYKLGKKKEALKTIEVALKMDEKEPMCYSNRGLIFLKIDKKNNKPPRSEILADFNKALDLEIPYRRYRCYTDLAEYYLYAGNPKKARKSLKKALNLYGQYERAKYYLAKYHKKRGNNKKYKRYMVKSKIKLSYP